MSGRYHEDLKEARECIAMLRKPIADNDGALAALAGFAREPDGDYHTHTGDDPGGCEYCHAVQIADAFLKRTEPSND